MIASGVFTMDPENGFPAGTPDGPFVEMKEVLAGFAVIDVVGHERAVEITARIVEALGEPIEIRPIMGEEFTA